MNTVHKDTPDIGDKVRATYKRGTVQVTVVGVVANISRVSGGRIYEAECGSILYRTADTVKVEMLERYQAAPPPLFQL